MNLEQIWKTRSYRITLIVSLSVIFLFILLNLLLTPVLNGIIKPKLLAKVNTSNLNIQIDHVGYSIFTNRVSLNNVQLIQHEGKDTLKLNIVSLDLWIDWFHYAFSDGYKFNGIEIENLIAQQAAYPLPDTSDNKKDDNVFGFLDSLSGGIPWLSADYLSINNGFYFNKDLKSGLTDSIQNFSLRFDNVLLDSSLTDKLKLKIADEFEFAADKIDLFFGDMLYRLSFDSLSVSSSEKNISLKKLSFGPYLSDNNFFGTKIFRADRFRITAGSFQLSDFDFDSLLNRNKIQAENILLKDFTLDALTNMRLPVDPTAKPPEMPNEIVNDIPFKLNIKKMDMVNGNILVKELYPYDENPGLLQFADLNATAYNIKNNENVHFDISTRLTGSGKLDVSFDIGLFPGEMKFSYSGKLGAMSAKDLNKFIVIADRVRVTSGDVKEVHFKIEAVGDTAIATVTPVYSGLSVNELDDETGKASGLIEKFNSFIANTFVIRENNSGKPEDIKTSTTVYVRKSDNAFLEYVWIALRTSLGDVVGFE